MIAQAEPTPLIELRGIVKAYPGVKVLSGVDFDVHPGEVHALAGENGAGKSTLMKIMAGVVQPDKGEIRWQGLPIRFAHPGAALATGIHLIHQELNLVPHLSVAENIFLGCEPRRFGFVRRAMLLKQASSVIERLGARIDPRRAVATLSVGQQQLVEIAKALASNARVIAMDEPTSALTEQETHRLFALVERLKADGVGIIYISHRLEEYGRIVDRVTVLRDGAAVGTRTMKELAIPELIRMMVARAPDETYPRRLPSVGEVVLRVEKLERRAVLEGISFEVRKGEILGIAGLMGSGRTELLRALFGADPIDGGVLTLDGKRLRLRSPADAIRAGIALAPEDRKLHGLLLGLSVRENISLANLSGVARRHVPFWIDRAVEREAARGWIQSLGVKTPSEEQPVRALSGGNQQKVVLSKWLFTHPRVLLLDEPTRGIDVGAKAEIYALMNRLVDDGVALVMVSSELPEILGMSDRIAVMHEGRLAAIVPRAEATQERLMHYATGQAGPSA